MSNTSLAFHDITKVELHGAKPLWPLAERDLGKVQHIVLYTKDGSRHELSLYLEPGSTFEYLTAGKE